MLIGYGASVNSPTNCFNPVQNFPYGGTLATWFKTTSLNPKIEAIEVSGETERFITIVGETRKSAKRGEYWNFFPTWDAAHSYLMDMAGGKVKAARRQLELANATFGNIKGMKPPTQSCS